MLSEDTDCERTESAKSGSPIVLVHGFLGEPEDWDATVANMQVDRRVVRARLLDSPCERFDLASLAEALAREIENTGLAPATVVGYSLGGRVALTLANDRPELVRRAMLVSATPGLFDDDDRGQRSLADDALADELERQGIAAFVDRWYAQPLFASLLAHPDYGFVARRRSAGETGVSGRWARVLRDASPGRNPSLWHRLSALAERLTLVVGSLDAKYLGLAREAQRVAPLLRIDTVSGAGHAIHLERPAELAALIDQLLP